MNQHEETLRDLFAGLALCGMLSTVLKTDSEPKQVANLAYILADAMMEQRRASHDEAA